MPSPHDDSMTQDRLREILHYDPETGVFSWRAMAWPTVKAGKVAGSDNGDGYTVIRISGTNYRAHRLAFLYMTGSFPTDRVYHINRDRSDNRWDNLREATESQNHCNSGLSKQNTSGVKGVSWNKSRRKWVAQIRINGRMRHIGYFDSISSAANAYAEAALLHFGVFANPAKANSTPLIAEKRHQQ